MLELKKQAILLASQILPFTIKDGADFSCLDKDEFIFIQNEIQHTSEIWHYLDYIWEIYALVLNLLSQGTKVDSQIVNVLKHLYLAKLK